MRKLWYLFLILAFSLVPFACDKSTVEPENESKKLGYNARAENEEKSLAEQIAEDEDFLAVFSAMERNNEKIVSYFINLSKEDKQLLLNRLKIKSENKKINLATLDIGINQQDLLIQYKSIAKFVKHIHNNFKEFKSLSIKERRKTLENAYFLVISKKRKLGTNQRVEGEVCDLVFGYCTTEASTWYAIESTWCYAFNNEPYQCLSEATDGFLTGLAECVGDYLICRDNPGGN